MLFILTSIDIYVKYQIMICTLTFWRGVQAQERMFCTFFVVLIREISENCKKNSENCWQNGQNVKFLRREFPLISFISNLENAIFFPNKSYSSFIELKSKHQLIPLFRSQLYVLFFCLCWIWWKKCKKMKSKSVNNRITEMYKPAIKWLQWKWLQLCHVLVYDLDKMV